MKNLLRAALTAAAGFWLLLFTTAPAWGHASLRASEPSGGAAVEEAPEQVTITFTESPDTSLTSVRVTGASGSFEDGPPRLAEGDDLTVVVDLKPLPQGSYTVAWRTVSRVDGHASAGAFAFGVGEPPDPAAAEEQVTEISNKVPAAAARWVLYLGLTALFGAAWMALFAFGHTSPPLRRLARFGWVAAIAGLVGLGVFQFREAGAGLGVFLRSSSGQDLAFRAVPLAVAGFGIAVLSKKHRLGMAVAGAGALGTMLAHAAAGHGAVPPNAVAKVGVQWLHLTAIGLWIGGLAALLIGMSHTSGDPRQRAVRRFSLVAGIAIFVVAATGVLRAVNEVGSWEGLLQSTYGRLVIAKSALIVVLGILGALNRFRNVPVSAGSPQGLQKVGRLEVAIAVITLALAGMLSSSVPPVSVAAAGEEPRVSVEGTDFARTVEATLVVEPGTAGPNRFTVELTDLNSDSSLEDVNAATLRFVSLSNPAVGESNVELERSDDGRFEATGSNVSVPGRWRATLSVTTAGNSFEIPLEFSTRAPGYTFTDSAVEGQPTIYSVIDPEGRQMQTYAEPDEAGPSELHLTLFDASGTELTVDEITAIVVPPGEQSVALVTRRLSPGHFIADVTLKSGSYLLDITVTTGTGENLRFPAEMEISP